MLRHDFMKLGFEGPKPLLHAFLPSLKQPMRTKHVVYGDSAQLEKGAASEWAVDRTQA